MAKTLAEPPRRTIAKVRRSSRDQLIDIQKSIIDSLKKEIRMSVGKGTREFETYLEEYNRQFKTYQRRSGMEELVHSVCRAGIVYNGDYHTMAQAQRIPIRILRRVIARRPRVTLAVEVIRIDQQKQLDRFMAGQLSEHAFLKAVDYEKTWGFPWVHYRDLFLFARDNRIRIIGINTEPKKGRWLLKKRDRAAARVIAREYIRRPDRLLYVFDGDLHITPSHLPAMVDDLLAGFGVRPKTVTVYQNDEQIYWELARAGLEQETDVVLMSQDQFCVMSTPPIIKFQSYLNWINNTRELTHPSLGSWSDGVVGEENLYSQILGLIKIITRFMEIRTEGLENFLVYSPADLDFLGRVRDHSGLAPAEVEAVAAHIRSNESYFIEDGNIIYIANLSINHAAEEATHFIHKLCAGPRRRNLNRLEDFYSQVMREAVGFFGSKIVNHKRPCHYVDDFEDLRSMYPTKPTKKIEELETIGKFVRQHKRYEEMLLSKETPWRLEGPMYQLPPPIHIGVTHTLGYMLGDSLFKGLMRGLVRKRRIRDLFFMNFSDLGQSLATYLAWISAPSKAGLK